MDGKHGANWPVGPTHGVRIFGILYIRIPEEMSSQALAQAELPKALGDLTLDFERIKKNIALEKLSEIVTSLQNTTQ